MVIKSKTCDIRTWKIIISRRILHQHWYTWYTCPIAYQCVETRSIQVEVFLLLSQSLPHLRFNLFVISEMFAAKAETLYATDTSHRKKETYLYEYPLHWVLLPTKMAQHNAVLRFYTLKHGRRFDYWNQPLNMRMRVCYVDCDEAGLCCYLVTHTENRLRPLQLFYFHLWPIYWPSVVY
jgi:hypothetical protein